MKLELSGTELTEKLDEAIIVKSLQTLGVHDDSFLILSKEGVGYIQTLKANDGTYILEYREGAEEAGHYECADEALTFQKVSAAFISYLNGTDEWKTSLKWVPLGSSEKGNATGGPVKLLVLVVIVALIASTFLILAL